MLSDIDRYVTERRQTGGGTAVRLSSCPVRREGGVLPLCFQRTSEGFLLEGTNADLLAQGDELGWQGASGIVKAGFGGGPFLPDGAGGLMSKGLSVRPVPNGFAAEVSGERLRDFELKLDFAKSCLELSCNESSFSVMNGRYAPFFRVSPVLARRARGSAFPLRMRVRTRDNRSFFLRFCAEGAERILFEGCLHDEKLIWDTTVETGDCGKNNAFGSIAALGYTYEFGEQRLFGRFNAQKLHALGGTGFTSASLYMPILWGSVEAELFRVKEWWCGFGMNEKISKVPSEFLCRSQERDGYLVFDVTEIVREIFVRGLDRDNGYFIRASRRGTPYALLATGDCLCRPQVLELCYRR